MSIRKGSTIIAGNIGQNVDNSLSLTSTNPVRNSVIARSFANTLNRKQISNCILEEPKNISLSLYNSVLTALMGTKTYVPDGFEQDGTTKKFSSISLPADLQLTVGNNGVSNEKNYVVVNSAGTASYAYNSQSIFSGDNAPTPTGNNALWYDTANNIIRQTTNGGATWSSSPISFPICIAINTNGLCDTVQQIFNSKGVIGSTFFALPGIKGLIPNKTNEDGTLNNIEFEIETVLTCERNLTQDNVPVWYKSDDTILFSKGWYYDDKTNAVRDTLTNNSTGEYCLLGYVDLNAGVITNFRQNQIFKALDRNDTEFISHQAFPSKKYKNLTLGASGTTYTAPDDGWFCINKCSVNANEFINMVVDNIYSVNNVQPVPGYNTRLLIPVSKNSVVTITYDLGGTTELFRFIYANGIEE